MSCGPGAAGATPIVPANGASGMRAFSPYRSGALPVVPVVQGRFREVVGEQTEAGYVCRPAPTRRSIGEDADAQNVTGLCAVDENRAGHRIDARGVVGGKNVGGTCLGDLASRGVGNVEGYALVGRDRQDGCMGFVPRVVAVMAVNCVLGGDHRQVL